MVFLELSRGGGVRAFAPSPAVIAFLFGYVGRSATAHCRRRHHTTPHHTTQRVCARTDDCRQQNQKLTGEPLAPSWMRTLTMSIGWIRHVANMPLAPPLTNGLTVFHASDMVAKLCCAFCLWVCVVAKWWGDSLFGPAFLESSATTGARRRTGTLQSTPVRIRGERNLNVARATKIPKNAAAGVRAHHRRSPCSSASTPRRKPRGYSAPDLVRTPPSNSPTR